MKNRILVLSFTLVIFTCISACQPSGSGPHAWIDRPLDNDVYPLQTVILQAHASDADGVASMELAINEQVVKNIDAGGGRMGQVAFNWEPPGTGEYTLRVIATDNDGNESMAARNDFTIVGEIVEPQAVVIQPEIKGEEQEEDEEEEDEVQTAEEPVEEEVPQTSNEPYAVAKQTANCREGPGTAYDVLASLKTDQQAPIIGRNSDRSWLVLIPPKTSLECWSSTSLFTIYGDLGSVAVKSAPPPPQQPAEEQPPVEPPPPEAPPPDTTAPTVMSVSASPTVIYQQYCSGEAQTTTVTVQAADTGGIAKVSAAWFLGSSFGNVDFGFVGGNSYQGVFGPIGANGTLLIQGSVVDNSGNWTPFSINVTVKNCLG